MPSPHVITPSQLARRIGLPDAPVLIDVRMPEDAAADPRSLPGSRRAAHDDVADWAEGWRGREVVVICQKGLKLSHGVAAWLRHHGAEAETLEGGFQAWAEAGLPAADVLSPDGLHHNDRGYACLAEALAGALLEAAGVRTVVAGR